jgi:hypothetical protein
VIRKRGQVPLEIGGSVARDTAYDHVDYRAVICPCRAKAVLCSAFHWIPGEGHREPHHCAPLVWRHEGGCGSDWAHVSRRTQGRCRRRSADIYQTPARSGGAPAIRVTCRDTPVVDCAVVGQSSDYQAILRYITVTEPSFWVPVGVSIDFKKVMSCPAWSTPFENDGRTWLAGAIGW